MCRDNGILHYDKCAGIVESYIIIEVCRDSGIIHYDKCAGIVESYIMRTFNEPFQ